jgi:hypothetical protein
MMGRGQDLALRPEDVDEAVVGDEGKSEDLSKGKEDETRGEEERGQSEFGGFLI